MKPQAFIFMGRAGAGKGTQARLLDAAIKAAGDAVLNIETGAEFRKFVSSDNYTARLNKTINETGGLSPAFMPIYMWARVLVDGYTGGEHLIFDGTPRLQLEAQVLESLFPFYSLGKPWVIYLDIDHDESTKRLSIRAAEGRKDDHPTAIERRRTAFENDVRPTIEWYRANPNVNFLDIDGERSIEEIHADIAKRVGLK